MALCACLLMAVGCKTKKGPAGPVDERVLDLGGGLTVELVLIPAGEFTMGSPDSEPTPAFHSDTESLQHKVKITKPFYMSKYPITREQCLRFTKWYVSDFHDPKQYPDIATNGRLPADSVAWNDCTDWCKEAAKQTGRNVRLPTEAEWEYACRAGTTTAFYCGETLLPEYACFDSSGMPGGKKHLHPDPVGSYKPNAFGLYDMHGNMGQWVQDNMHDNYENAPADGSAWKNTKEVCLHVYRGGSWLNSDEVCRSAMRCAGGSDDSPDLRTNTVGFRIVVEAKAQNP